MTRQQVAGGRKPQAGGLRLSLALLLLLVLSTGLLGSCAQPPAAPTAMPDPTAPRLTPARGPATPTPLPPTATAAPSPRPSLTPTPTRTPTPTPRPSRTPTAAPSPTPTEAPLPESVFVDVVSYGQERMLTCEAATIRVLLHDVGVIVPEDEVQDCFPITANPEEGFRGPDVDASMSLDNYGAHAPAVARVIQQLLDRHDRPYRAVWQTFAGREPALHELRRQLAAGRPVIVWMTWQARNGEVPAMRDMVIPLSVTLELPDPLDGGGMEEDLVIYSEYTVTLVFGEHVEVVYGLDGSAFHVVDPYGFRKREGRMVNVYPDGFYYRWPGPPPGWQYFDYAMVYIVPLDD
ncbi:MAG: hypothetical protein JXA37_05240 [Chloroflexia bacterium]|nr:hypothetical protein [Chloroflexia bacterium]